MTQESASTSTIKKQIYLIRHAESEENRRLKSLQSIGKGLKRWTLPSRAQLWASMELINVPQQVDSPVSDFGQSQITYMQQKLQTNDFLLENHIDLIVHSPLLRAKQTCQGILGYSDETNDRDGNSKDHVVDTNKKSAIRVVQSDLLLEKTPTEWITTAASSNNSFFQRIQALQEWLLQQPQTNIVLVGHSQFFKAMLRLSFKFGNCDVWKVTLDASKLASSSSSSSMTDSVTSNNESPIEEEEEEKKETEVVENDDCQDDMAMVKDDEYPNLPPQFSNLQELYACDLPRETSTDDNVNEVSSNIATK